MSKLEAVLLLGCNSSAIGDFSICTGIVNPVIDLSTLDNITYDKVLAFLDNACNMLDKPVTDQNKCSNIINYLHKTYSIFDEEMLYKIQSFVKVHKGCGLYMLLILKEDFYGR